MSSRSVAIIALGFVTPMLLGAGNASAQSSQSPESAQSPEFPVIEEIKVEEDEGDWDGFLGLAVAARPLYEGSGETSVSPFPLLRVTWRDRIELGPGGLNLLFSNTESLRWGVGVTYDQGRDEQDGRSSFSDGDAEEFLRGMGDVDAAAGLRVFAATRLGPVLLQGSATKFSADEDPLVPQNDGALVELGATLPFARGDRWRLAGRFSTTWADESYTQAFFGVTPTQSARSGYSTYTPGSGMKNAFLGLRGEWDFSDRWFLTGDVGVTRLLGDAADSPLVEEETAPSVSIGVGYRF